MMRVALSSFDWSLDVMRRVLVSTAVAMVMCGTGVAPASAQSSEPLQLSVGVSGGLAAVEHIGVTGGVEVAIATSSRISVFGEAVWFNDVVTRRRVDTAESIAGYLTQTRGVPATGVIEVPASAFTVGARLWFGSAGGLRPYVAVQAGVARLTLKPIFTLAGTDVTTTLDQYGVTLGEDMTGTTVAPAFGGGLGVALDRGVWTFDAGLRILTVRGHDQATNISRLAFGISRTF